VRLDLERLRDGLDAFVDRRSTIGSSEVRGNRLPPPSPVINGIETIPTARIRPAPNRRVLLDALYTATRDLAGRAEDRRRTIIVITDGSNVRSEAKFEDVRLALLDARIQVYPIGLNLGWLSRLTDSLDEFAEITGGTLYYRHSESLEQAYSEITGQAHNQYLLTYVSNNPNQDDTTPFREIEIRGNPYYDIDHRSGYYQTPGVERLIPQS
jgi:VWFA-related protein